MTRVSPVTVKGTGVRRGFTSPPVLHKQVLRGSHVSFRSGMILGIHLFRPERLKTHPLYGGPQGNRNRTVENCLPVFN